MGLLRYINDIGTSSPVTSFIQAPNNNLSKFIARVLNNIRYDSINVRIVIHSNCCQKSKISNDMIVSFDVVSMYTCIPHNLDIDCTIGSD